MSVRDTIAIASYTNDSVFRNFDLTFISISYNFQEY